MRAVAKDTLKFIAGFILVLLISAFLAPWLTSFLPFKFDRILRRLIMIGTIILMWGLIRARKESLSRLGLGWEKDSLQLLWKGFLFGLVLVSVMTLVQWGLGVRFFKLYQGGVGRWIGLFFKALGGGLLIGLIEEFFFRGFLFVTFKDLWNTKASLIITNLIYSLVHFFPKGKVPIGSHPTLMDSFRIYLAVPPSSPEFVKILPGILGLFFFGLILSFTFLRTGSLFSSIGIHAGAVFTLKLNRPFLSEISEKMGILSGGQRIYDGVAGLAVLALFAFMVGMGLKKIRTGPAKKFSTIMILFFFFLPISSFARAEEKPAEKVIYSFLPFLSQTRVTRSIGDKLIEQKWVEGRLHSDQLPPLVDVFTSDSVVVGGAKRSAIWFPPLFGFDSVLEFTGVPPARKLKVFYALPDESFKEDGKTTPVQFEVWIGKKKLFESLVGTKGWKEKSVDLAIPYFLRRRYQFSFRVRTGDADPKSFVFYAYLE